MDRSSKNKTSKLGFKDRARTSVLAGGAVALMRLIGTSLRTHGTPVAATEHLRRPGIGRIWALWHGDHFPSMWTFRRYRCAIITSQSRDGELLARILKSLGHHTVRGSSTRGGIAALSEMGRLVRQEAEAVVAVDGPRGPRHHAKAGVLLLAKLTGAPVIPVAAAVNRAWRFRSWDQYELPKPFARSLVLFGPPIYVDRNADDQTLELQRVALELSLCELREKANAAVQSRALTEAAVAETVARMSDEPARR